jgi:hypothetical protein
MVDPVGRCVLLRPCTDSGSNERLSRDEYLQRLRDIEAWSRRTIRIAAFFEIVTPGLPREACLARAQEFDGNLHDTIDEVASLSPPRASITPGQVCLSGERTIGEVDDAVEDVQSGTPTCGMPMNRRICGLPSTQRAQDVLGELRTRGYKLGSNSE